MDEKYPLRIPTDFDRCMEKFGKLTTGYFMPYQYI
jgi:hypothetical protein